MRADRGGFTLIEVLVAMTIGAFVVLAAHQTFAAAIDSSARLEEARAAHEAAMRARPSLARLFANLDVLSPGVTGFHGTAQDVAFTAAGEGEVTLRAQDGWLIVAHRDTVVRLLPATGASFDYLLHTGASEAWVRAWQSPVSAPVAVRVRLRHAEGSVDTLLFAIGERG